MATIVISARAAAGEEEEHDDQDEQHAVAQRRPTFLTATSMKSACRKMSRWRCIPAGQPALDLPELAVEPGGELEGVRPGLPLDAEEDGGLGPV
jgi:hypothetical protein